jgi:hypothetical protein
MQQSPTASVRHCFPSARRFFYGFFDLRTRIAGEIVQKFAMYGKRDAIVESPQELTAAVHGR